MTSFYKKISIKLPHVNHDLLNGIMQQNLSHGRFKESIVEKNPSTLEELVERTEKYISIEEEIEPHFPKQVLTEQYIMLKVIPPKEFLHTSASTPLIFYQLYFVFFADQKYVCRDLYFLSLISLLLFDLITYAKTHMHQ